MWLESSVLTLAMAAGTVGRAPRVVGFVFGAVLFVGCALGVMFERERRCD